MCCTKTSIDSLYTTIIPAMAGIIGVVLGIMSNVFIKYIDNKEKRRLKLIESFETYFYSLQQQLKFLLFHVEEYKNMADFNPKQLLVYKNLTQKDNSVLDPIINRIKEDVTNIFNFLSESTYNHSGNFKVQFYYDKCVVFLTELKNALDSNKESDEIISFYIIEKLCVQIEDMINPVSYIYKFYLSIWKFFRNRELNNYNTLSR